MGWENEKEKEKELTQQGIHLRVSSTYVRWWIADGSGCLYCSDGFVACIILVLPAVYKQRERPALRVGEGGGMMRACLSVRLLASYPGTHFIKILQNVSCESD